VLTVTRPQRPSTDLVTDIEVPYSGVDDAQLRRVIVRLGEVQDGSDHELTLHLA
jgi:hypothetical protein